jgi:beta-phosphoglucomutase
MTEFSNIKGFAFDLDGVITDTAKFHDQAWHALANRVGAPWSEELSDKLKGISRMDSLEMILAAGGLEAQYTQAEKEELAASKNAEYVELIKQIKPTDILPGIKEFLDEAKAGDYKMSIASASKNAPAILNALEITDYFVGIVDPATLTLGKPDPEIFTKAGEILELDPSQIVGFEDAAAGVLSIKGAGMTALGIGESAKESDPQLWVADTSEISLKEIEKQLS